MMKKVVKLCSIALILLLLLSVVASCGGNKTTSGDSETDTATVETSDNVDTEKGDVDTEKGDVDTEKGDVDTEKGDVDTEKGDVDTEEGDVDTEEGDVDTEKDDAPVAIMDDFGGYQFKVLTRGSGMYTSNDITGEVKGDVLSLATYKRNMALEEKYNFVIIETKDKNWNTTAQTLGGSGEHKYDMWSFKMADMPSHGQEGFIHNLNELDGINLDASYYDQTTRKSVSFANYLFFITGDMLYMDDLGVSCVLYHPTIWDTFNSDDVYGKDIYTLVKDGEWTFEVFTTLAKRASADANGDGIYDNKNDNWGCGYANGDIFTLAIGLGSQVIEKDADDVFYLNMDIKLQNDLSKIFEFFNSQACIKDGTYIDETHLFQLCQLANGAGPTSNIRKAGIEYGIVPVPKSDEGQDGYRSYVSAYAANCIAIPTTIRNDDIDKICNIIELISYESQNTLTPKFSEYLFYNLIQHAADIEMVEILMKTKTYENAYVWSTGGIYTTLIELNLADGSGIATAFEKSEEAVTNSVERKLQRIRQLA